jgi:hypothetical protein
LSHADIERGLKNKAERTMYQTKNRTTDLSQPSLLDKTEDPVSPGSAPPIFGQIKKAFQNYGPKKTAYLIARNLLIKFEEHRLKKFDRKYGIDTIGDVPIGELDVKSVNKESGEGFYSTPFLIVDRFFSALPNDLSDYTFIDIGSGKGRILAYANQFNFKKRGCPR